MDAKPFKLGLRDVASRIYVELAAQGVQISEDGVKMKASAENLARLSFKLAAAFESVQDELNAENLPRDPNFVMNEEAMAKWAE